MVKDKYCKECGIRLTAENSVLNIYEICKGCADV